MGTMKKIGFLCCVLLIGAGAANATLGTSLNDDDLLASETGYTVFQAIDGSNHLYGGVSYAVYHTEDWYGGSLYNPLGKWLYAYQIEISRASNINMDTFAVNIPDSTAVYNVRYDTSDKVGWLTGITSSSQTVVGNSVVWQFNNDPLGRDTYSAVLLFTSDSDPGQSNAAVAVDGVTGSVSFSVMAPVPEPATLALLGIGGAALLRRRSH